MNQVLQFLKEVREEFKNISWPKRDALIQLTFVVISISIIISLVLGGFDYIFTQSINYLGQPAAPQINPPVGGPTATSAPINTLPTTKPTIILKK